MNLRYNKPTELYDFKVDRTSIVGNPFQISKETHLSLAMCRDTVCDKYDIYFPEAMKNDPKFSNYIAHLIIRYKQFNKLRLFCWCAPKRCHAETIRNYILREVQEQW